MRAVFKLTLSKDFANMLHPPDPESWIFTRKSDKSRKDTHPGGHGTCVASKAVGSINGVSKASHLVPVKIAYNSESLSEAFEKILDDVHIHRRGGAAVIVCSVGSRSEKNIPSESFAVLYGTMELLSGEFNILVVFSTGNHADRQLRVGTYPAIEAIPLVGQITVGSTTYHGVRSTFSQANLLTLWAPGKNVACAGLQGEGQTVVKTGTSFAAPAVSFTVCLTYVNSIKLTAMAR